MTKNPFPDILRSCRAFLFHPHARKLMAAIDDFNAAVAANTAATAANTTAINAAVAKLTTPSTTDAAIVAATAALAANTTTLTNDDANLAKAVTPA